MSYRPINDPGECATLLTVQFPDEKLTEKVVEVLHSKSLFYSGWHVYNNMEQLLEYTDASGQHPYYKNMLARTDAILRRSVNLSVGVVDAGLGADFGINVLSSEEEIYQKAEEFVRILQPIVG